jgi:hypothetical protein
MQKFGCESWLAREESQMTSLIRVSQSVSRMMEPSQPIRWSSKREKGTTFSEHCTSTVLASPIMHTYLVLVVVYTS